jgi:membrane protein DedA with SNARE-associated domain
MAETLDLLVRHGPLVLFVIMAIDQIGLPVPMDLFLLATGALVGSGKLAFLPSAAALAVAGLLCNALWYGLGRRYGSRLLAFLCRISLEPDSCVRRTEGVFERHGVKSLLLAKIIPGLNAVAPPLSGIFRVPFGRFLAWDFAGLLLWILLYVGLGAAFHDQLEAVAAWGARLGAGLAWSLGALLAAYLLVKYVRRALLIRRLRALRVSADELKAALDAGTPLVIVDLRHALAVQASPFIIPGALRMTPGEVSQRHVELPRDRDIILYCA